LFKYGYSDIPDTVPSKCYIPLGEKFWGLVRELGWQYFENKFNKVEFFTNVGEFFREKFHTSVRTAKQILDGKIKNPDKVFTTSFFPPVLYIRSDLQFGTAKLIYGDSVDVTFVILNDTTHEIDLLINGHIEEGIQNDFWILNRDHEIFDQKHEKLGVKFREIPKNVKNFTKSGFYIMDILREFRNKRTLQWSWSAYIVSLAWVSAAFNMLLEFSNYNTVGTLWDVVNAPRVYGMPDYYGCYVPWPPLLISMLHLNRPNFINRFSGLIAKHHLFINALEPKHMTFDKEVIPEVWELMKRDMREGLPTPRMTLGCKPPDFKGKAKVESGQLNWSYPIESKIKPYEWGLTDEEAFGGIYTDITNETPPKEFYGKEHVISMGIGKEPSTKSTCKSK
jgi:hypothetical protein